MARKPKSETVQPIVIPPTREVPTVTSPLWDRAAAIEAIHRRPTGLDLTHWDFSDRRPCRPISSASPWEYDE
jgi:hypothetical protein